MEGPAIIRTGEMLTNHFLVWLIVGLVDMTAVMRGMSRRLLRARLCAQVWEAALSDSTDELVGRYCPLMRNSTPTLRGTRSELSAKLREMAEGWDHLAKPELSEAAKAGAEQLEEGASSVQVGRTRYVVTDTSV